MSLSRSEQMSRIRGKNTEPERLLCSALGSLGHFYRLQYKTPIGRPDVVFPENQVAVFIDGCFWHGCPAHYVRPCSREPFWSGKLTENVTRDRKQTLELEYLGWKVVRAWEHEVFEELDAVVARIGSALSDDSWDPPDDWRVVRVVEIDAESRTETRMMEKLRNPDEKREVTGRRITAKWKRAKPPAT